MEKGKKAKSDSKPTDKAKKPASAAGPSTIGVSMTRDLKRRLNIAAALAGQRVPAFVHGLIEAAVASVK